MDLKDIISNSLDFPIYNKEHVKKWLIFGLITLAGYLLIPLIFAAGYQLRTIRKTIKGDSELPEFNEWVKMFTDGFKVIVAQLIYYLAPLIFIFAGVVSFYMGKGWGMLLILVGIILFIPALMLFAVAISNFAYHGNFGAAFDLKEIVQRIKTIGKGRFIIWWIATILIAIIMAALGEFINIGSRAIGFFLVPLIFDSFVALFEARSQGLIYRDSLDGTEEVVNETE